MRWEDLNGTYLGYSNGEVGTAAGGLPSSFTEKGGTVTAPAGAVFGRVEVYFYLASGWLNVDDVSVTPTTTTNTTETLYYGFGGDTVALRVDGELSRIFSDQLGSTGITYQADGSATTRQFYYPFGGIRNPGGAPVINTDVGFTGQRFDETTGLMFYQARYYDPLTARFISADTMIPDPGNPQDFNRYSYVRNNPLKYTDPTGNIALDCLSPFDDPRNGCGGGSLAPEIVEDLVTPLKVAVVEAPSTLLVGTAGFVWRNRYTVGAVVLTATCIASTAGVGSGMCLFAGKVYFVAASVETVLGEGTIADKFRGIVGNGIKTAILMSPGYLLKLSQGASWAWNGVAMSEAQLAAQAASWAELAVWQRVMVGFVTEIAPLTYNIGTDPTRERDTSRVNIITGSPAGGRGALVR